MSRETLKFGHTLRGKKLTPLIRTIRRSTANPTDLARVDPSRPTEDMSLEEMEDIFSTLTGETMEDILEMAGREVTMPNGQLLIHHTIVYANEVGQPSEQDLVDTPITSDSGNAEETSTSETPIKRQRLDDNTREKELLERIKVLEEAVSLSASQPNPDYDDQEEETVYKPLLHEAASAPKQVVPPCSQSFSSSSSSAPIPGPSMATRPVAAPATSSSASSQAHAAEVLGEPESHRQLPSTSTGGPQRALTMKASDIIPEVSKPLLQNNRMVLVNNGDFSHIKDQLLQDGILTAAEVETVNLPVLSRGGKMSELVDILVLKPDNHVVRFFESLEKADGVLYSQLDMSPEKTRSDNCSSSGKTDHLSIIKKELKDWYKQSMAKINPMPWCDWFEQDLDHVYTNVRVVKGKKHRISHSPPGGDTVSDYDSTYDEYTDDEYTDDEYTDDEYTDNEYTLEKDPYVEPTGDEYTDGEPTDKMDAFSNLVKVFNPTDKRIVCLMEGRPGVGKSILCRRSVHLWSMHDCQLYGRHFDVVLLVTANMLKGEFKTDIYEQLFSTDFDLSEMVVYSCLKEHQKNALLVIDGVDEINAKGKDCVMKLLKGTILRNINVLLTGRPEASRAFVKYATSHLKICGFTRKNINTYISRYFSTRTNGAERLRKLLLSHKSLARLARTPFTTLLLCILADETQGDLPDKIDEIYHQVISLVFQKYVRTLTDRTQCSAHSTSPEEVPGAAETSEAAEITETQLLQGAASLAYNLEREWEQNCQEKELPNICNKADHLLKSGILNRDYTLSRMHDASAYCYFPHRSIQEYLCAWYLSTSTDKLAKDINVFLLRSNYMIMEFYISILCRDAQTALTNVSIAWDVVNNADSRNITIRRDFGFLLAEALRKRIPNKATQEFLVERIFGTFESTLSFLGEIQTGESYLKQLYPHVVKMLLTDGPLSQRSHKYDRNVSRPDVPVMFRLQHCVHYSLIPAPSDAGDDHGGRLSFGTAVTLLPNNVGRQTIDNMRFMVCEANILIVLVFEDLHDDSSQKDILFVLNRLWDLYGYRHWHQRDWKAKHFLSIDIDETPRLIRLRPTIRVEAAVHPETKLSRTVSVDCSLKTPFYKMYYDRFCPY